jgi:hypothetical protein
VVKPAVQVASRACEECGTGRLAITPTDSPWGFDWRCSACGFAGTISWAHAAPPPVFKGSAQPKAPADDLFSLLS